MTKSAIMKTALAVVLLMVIFPPFELYGAWGQEVIHRGYSFIFALPECLERSDNCGFDSQVDVFRLLIQVVIVGIVAFIGAHAVNSKD